MARAAGVEERYRKGDAAAAAAGPPSQHSRGPLDSLIGGPPILECRCEFRIRFEGLAGETCVGGRSAPHFFASGTLQSDCGPIVGQLWAKCGPTGALLAPLGCWPSGVGGQADELLPGVGGHSSSSAEVPAAGVGGHSSGRKAIGAPRLCVPAASF